jgi:uncharacterized protein YbjT (DUF2867 family)
VRALARRPETAAGLRTAGCEVRRADVLERESLDRALEGAGVAYYLVHSMGRGGSDSGFASRDRTGAENFAAAAAAAGVRRIVYLGGLGEGSPHLSSRHETGRALGRGGVPLVYFRAAAVIGAGSESFRTVYYLVRRLPAMVTPRWVGTQTQPIAIDDVVDYLQGAAGLGPQVEREIEIGGPDVTTYGGMMDALARATGRRPRPRIPVPLLSPALSSLWLGLVTPVDTGVARPLVEGMRTETVVRDPSGMRDFEVEPTPLEEAMRLAVAELCG